MIGPDVIVAIVVPTVLQAGASVYFAGSINRAVSAHEKRLDTLETTTAGTATAVARLQGKFEQT